MFDNPLLNGIIDKKLDGAPLPGLKAGVPICRHTQAATLYLCFAGRHALKSAVLWPRMYKLCAAKEIC